MLDIEPAQRQAPRPPAAGQALPRRPRAGPHRRGRRGQARGLDAAAVRRVVRGATSCTSTTSSRRTDDDRRRAAAAPAPARVRLHAGGPARPASRRWPGNGEEPIGSMGNDNALAVLSRPAPAAVHVLQAALRAGHEPADRPDPRVDRHVARHRRRRGGQPARRDARARPPAGHGPADPAQPGARDAAARLDTTSSRRTRSTSRGRSPTGPRACRSASPTRATRPTTRSRPGVNILILSDRAVGPERAPIPSLLAVAAVHHHLVREGTRLRAGLVLESGEPREVHHFATLIGYGASAINPYVLLDTSTSCGARAGSPGIDEPDDAERRTSSRRSARACSRRSPRWGSRRSSPTAARRSSRRSASRRRSSTATSPAPRRGSAASASTSSPRRRSTATPAPGRGALDDLLPVGGIYAWRRDGEQHMWNPETIALLQHAVRAERRRGSEKYDEYARMVNEDATRRATLRGLLALPRRTASRSRSRRSSPRRRSSSASRPARCRSGRSRTEAHETLAIAMNRLGGALEHRRGRGGPAPLHSPTPTATGAARRSSRSPRAASA